MELKSSLYTAHVMHERREPKHHRFAYDVFLFYLDLDEVDEVSRRITLMSHNALNVFSFKDNDHLPGPEPHLKDRVLRILRQQGVDGAGVRVMLLTYARTFGYYFNPVSFYFCFDSNDQAIGSIVEVENTFKERKAYFLGPKTLEAGRFVSQMPKHYYVSPFIDLEALFDFRLQLPGKVLSIQVDDLQDNRRFFVSTLTGKRQALTNRNVWWFAIRFPFITLKVILLIHWQAFLLHVIKKIPYHSKSANPHLQKEVLHAYRP